MATVSILGCGWLGFAAGRELIGIGVEVKASTTTPEKLETLRNAGFTPSLLQIDSAVNGESKFFECDFLIIAIPPGRKAGQSDIYLHRLKALTRTLESHSCKGIIMISSTSVYQNSNSVVREEDAAEEGDLRNAERILFDRFPGKTCILRMAGLVGPGRHPGKFLSGKEVTGGYTPVNLIHQRDCVQIIRTVIEKELLGDVFNCCADEHPSKEIFYTEASRLLSVAPPKFVRPSITDFKIVDNSKFKERAQYRYAFPDPLTMAY
jgi:nucleoside-diphosphate-sugar epimerase